MSEVRAILEKEWREQYKRANKKTGMFWGAFVVFPVISLLLGAGSVALAYDMLVEGVPLALAAAVPPVAVLLFMQLSAMVSSNFGLDSIAGERERHTLDTLLSFPVSTRNLFLGKLLLPVIVGTVATLGTVLLATIISTILFGLWSLLAGLICVVLAPLLIGQGNIGMMAFAMIFSARNESVKVAAQKMAYAMLPFYFIFPAVIFTGATDWFFEQNTTIVLLLIGGFYFVSIAASVLFVIIASRSFQRERLILA